MDVHGDARASIGARFASMARRSDAPPCALPPSLDDDDGRCSTCWPRNACTASTCWTLHVRRRTCWASSRPRTCCRCCWRRTAAADPPYRTCVRPSARPSYSAVVMWWCHARQAPGRGSGRGGGRTVVHDAHAPLSRGAFLPSFLGIGVVMCCWQGLLLPAPKLVGCEPIEAAAAWRAAHSTPAWALS